MAAKKKDETEPPQALYEPLTEAQCAALERHLELIACAVKAPTKFRQLYRQLYPHDADGGGTWLYCVEVEALKDVINASRIFRQEKEQWEKRKAEMRAQTAWQASVKAGKTANGKPLAQVADPLAQGEKNRVTQEGEQVVLEL